MASCSVLTCWSRGTCSVCKRTREFLWTFLLAPVAFPILESDFLSNFRLLVDISNKRLVAHGGKLIQLKHGKRTKAAVVTRVVAAAPPRAVALLLLHFLQWRHPAAVPQGCQSVRKGSQEAQNGGSGPTNSSSPISTSSLPTMEAPCCSSSGHVAAR